MSCNCGDLRSVHRRQHEFLNECNRGSTTVFSTTAPVELAPLAQPEHRTPYRRRTGEPLWSTRPWRIASASRQECPARPVQQGHRSPNPFVPTKSLDRGNRPLHHGKKSDDLHDLCTKDIDHSVVEQLGSFCGLLNSLDHGNRPLHHDREIDDLEDEQQLRKFHSFLHGTT